MIFFTSDTHFQHANIIDYCKRPFANVEEMNETIINNWNSVVTEEDKVIHVGDFSFGRFEKAEEIFNRLKGEKILIVGNHDEKWKNRYVKLFKEVHRGLSLEVDGIKIWLSHIPVQQITREDTLYINGHVHEKWLFNNNRINVGVDKHHFKLWSLDEIKKLWNEIKWIKKAASLEDVTT